MLNKAGIIRITGIVQGVGFRPFVFSLAEKMGLAGEVYNDGQGVVIHAEGARVEEFVAALPMEAPELARIDALEVQAVEPMGYEAFTIAESRGEQGRFALISPDVATCPRCLEELFDSQDPRYGYPFINCTNCGPRFTIIKDIPYDRKFTTMAGFAMCKLCGDEYHDPANRRFHAQPIACWVCGPQVQLWDNRGNIFPGEQGDANPVEEAQRLLARGLILAIKGLGGYHLACDALNEDAVAALRERKIREDKPFAVMMKDISQVRDFCLVGVEEEELLLSNKRPIVLLQKKQEGRQLASQVAPGNDFLGVMLPYTPLHHLLLRDGGALVVTSGNISSEPIVYVDEEVVERLGGIADYFLVHNREIFRRVDDSVTRALQGGEYLLRRSRGYVPDPIRVKWDLGKVLACGGEQKNVFALTRGNQVFMSHHIGDLENLETLQSFEEGIQHFQRLFNTRAEAIVYDLHPEYLSTKWALEQELPKVGVQHHQAHIAGVMAEYGLEEPVIGVAFDGTGYGLDGNLWGGEFFLGDYRGLERVAHLKYLPLPGGGAAIKEPWRMGCMYLEAALGRDFRLLDLPFLQKVNLRNWDLLRQAVDKGINAPLTSSMGRLFDGVAAILGLRAKVNYEGQGAVELEQLAVRAAGKDFQKELLFDIIEDKGLWVIDYQRLICRLAEGLQAGVDRAALALEFHRQVALLIKEVAGRCRQVSGVNKVALSGGVFQNLLLLEAALELLKAEGFEVFIHRQVPTNDGGIALGQALLAKAKL
ncbi:MAG: carbamoyltransferase HypF [Clostridia bacterium]|nr:carbamoyltransferase HypF [Clostridia bacterium]